MFKVGFEREFFVFDENGDVQLVPTGVPHDSGILAEVRGKPFLDPIEAAFSLKAGVYQIMKMCPDISLTEDYAVVPPELRIEARRSHVKGIISYENLYGYARHNVSADTMTAGVHVSLTYEKVTYVQKEKIVYNGMFDFAKFITLMDQRFAKEIAEAKRLPGFYEIKPDGRVEYRSLPQSIDIVQVAEFVEKIIPKLPRASGVA